MQPLIARIEALPPEQLVEAAQLLSMAMVDESTDETAARAATAAIAAAPYAHVREVEELARLVLRAAAEDPQYAPLVQKALEGAGRKQVILGGAEIVALATIGLLALQTIISKGKTRERQEEIVETDPKTGKSVLRVKKDVQYGLGASITELLKGFFQSR
jgi:hypothetical protein